MATYTFSRVVKLCALWYGLMSGLNGYSSFVQMRCSGINHCEYKYSVEFYSSHMDVQHSTTKFQNTFRSAMSFPLHSNTLVLEIVFLLSHNYNT